MQSNRRFVSLINVKICQDKCGKATKAHRTQESRDHLCLQEYRKAWWKRGKISAGSEEMDMISTGEKRKTVSMWRYGQEQRLRNRKVMDAFKNLMRV